MPFHRFVSSYGKCGLNDPDTERFLYEFTVQATLTGDFELTMPGSGLAIAEGEEILAFSDTTLSGDSGEFGLFSDENDDYYNFFESTTQPGTTPFSATGSSVLIPVEFSNGDEFNTITFHSSLLVNAVTDIPEPGTGLLLAALSLIAIARRRGRA